MAISLEKLKPVIPKNVNTFINYIIAPTLRVFNTVTKQFTRITAKDGYRPLTSLVRLG